MITAVDNTWTLFLDRDGVINERIPGQYISQLPDLKLTRGAEQAIAAANFLFAKVLVVTNQAGIGKGIMTEEDLKNVHDAIAKKIGIYGAKVDRFYHCPEKPGPSNSCRKPAPGMAQRAQQDFPSVDFEKSIMVGDSLSDIIFGQQLGMKTVLIKGKESEEPELLTVDCDLRADSLFDFMNWINNGELT